MKQMITISLLSIALSGCAGLAVGSFGTFESSSTRIEMPGPNTESNLTKDQVIAALGKPDEISRSGICEVLTYYRGYNWSGVGAFVLLIPVPLLVPSGHSEQRIHFLDGVSVGEITEYGEVSTAFGFMCGDNKCGFIAGQANENLQKHAKVEKCKQEL